MRKVFWIAISAMPLCAQVMDGLNAVAWQQTAVEYKASTLQAWNSARRALPKALKSRKWTAALEQTGKFKNLPPAIIVDADETVLDNSPGQARFLLDGNGRYSSELWMKWTAEKKAKAIPGAAEFLNDAASRGVTVFYVTNRGVKEESDTRENLVAAGFPVKNTGNAAIGDTLLMGGEKSEWTSDKGVRRKLLASHYRIIMLAGDDLNDFVPARVPLAEREALVKGKEAWWGERWIVLPNPMYGSWEDALFGFDRTLGPEEVQKQKKAALRRD